ncbi:MAG TPA: C69 family dipeptidase [Syntrophales bacterium]|nr:C69 family dipeptidase [Syntrophales bacterium]HQN78720.1 C69 family dipeptidase [Syntrophales bacterium]HQQ26482.1 C69 family dipeptidase [Syntrophales bacterium]
MRKILALMLVVVGWAVCGPADACTVTVVGRAASADGSVMVSHSDDGLGDARMIHVPAMDHKAGALRAVFYSNCALDYKPQWGASETQRIMTKDRGPGYDTPGVPPSVPLGFIPQVPHTYAYFDANYGIMNEHQLSIGECTDKAKVHPEPEPKKRIFYSAELSRVALERCKTAREAIRLMGQLIEKYGYYGTGETLTVADPKEGWVMEMCGYDMNGTDGVWIAQRVPDDGFFVAANQFRIRDVRKDAGDMMYSSNIFDVAQKKGWWKPEDGPLDWARVYGDGEFHHPYYSLRRVWRAQSLVAPSLDLPAWVEGAFTRKYPFAVKPDQKLAVANIFSIHRDNYEGTEFDMTKGLAAGPFGNPNRFEGQAESVADKEGRLTPLNGEFERPLNIYRCVYAYVNQSRGSLPDPIGGLTWFGPDRPATSVLMPFYAGATTLPEIVQRGDLLSFEWKSLWMAFNYVANYAMLKYSYMIQDIHAVRDRFEADAFGAQQELEARAAALWKAGDKEGARALLTRYSEDIAARVLKEWWKLAGHLYVKYNDGYVNTTLGVAQPVFYPAWWLKAVGYENGPTSYEKKPGGN